MIKDKDDFRYQGDNGSRDGNSSSKPRIERASQGEDPNRKKRPRVGDARTPVSRPNSNYSAGNSGYNDRNRSNYNDNRGNSDSNYRSNSYGGGDRERSSYGSGERSNNYPPKRNNDNNGNRSGGYNNNNNNNRGNSGGGNYGNRNSGGGGGYNNRNSNSSGGRFNNNNRSAGGYGGGGDKRYSSNNQNQDNHINPETGEPRKSFSRKKVLVRPVKYKENLDPTTALRLNKYLANAGVCSRREADSLITAGVVKVNGVVISELGAKVTRGDSVTFNDKPVSLESKIYVLLNKPKNCVTTSDDPQNRKTVMDLVKNACTERIYPVGRLDRSTTGVLLLTNDGDLASKLMHPKFKKKKIYQVTLDRDVAMEDMQAIADGVELDDGEIHADSIAYVAEDVLNEIGIEIHSGRNRVVRRIFEKLDYQVTKLDRVFFAGLTKKNLPRGKWRYLSEKEVNMLRMGAYE